LIINSNVENVDFKERFYSEKNNKRERKYIESIGFKNRHFNTNAVKSILLSTQARHKPTFNSTLGVLTTNRQHHFVNSNNIFIFGFKLNTLKWISKTTRDISQKI
jgi:hypothetical protein